MKNQIRYVHTNIIAENWKSLAQFYIDVFECEPVLPERDLSGEWIDKLTMLQGARLKGIHLKLPGYKDGPTLEIFEYNEISGNPSSPLINNKGLAHIAFHVSDVDIALDNLIANGGQRYGEIVEKKYDGIGTVRAVYAKDPEGNIIELQNWCKE